ncbi:MAG: LOW QUALITY PROTEIN: uncharacterized protein KVP18_001851 [Porospora cf. gigantea A]|uniref:uncharacterized protein n=1 Tax=Porospora cf. gigantea A TaxID=2853593 RepID=UPI00355A75BD|nr:MAG: LOW QUALITY PROTEIN: hypothetical protein KVP18_001851 [Porospora cf. gigantea A]
MQPTDDDLINSLRHLINSLRRSRPKEQFRDEDVAPLVVKPTPTRSTVLLPVEDTDVIDPVLTDESNPSPADDHLINSLRRSRQKMRPADDQLINSLRRSRQKMQPADEDVDLLVSFEECFRSPDPIQLHVADSENLLLSGTDLSTRCDIVSTEEGDLPTYHSWNAELSSTASPLRSLVSRNESDPQLVSFARRCQPKVQSPDEDVAALVVKPTPTRSTVLRPVDDTDVVDPHLTDESNPSLADDHPINSLRRSRPKKQFPDEVVTPLVVKPTPTRSTVLLPVDDTDVVDPHLTDESNPSLADDHPINSLRRSRPKKQFPDEDVAPLVVKPTPTRSTVLRPVDDTDVVDPHLTDESNPSLADDHPINSLRLGPKSSSQMKTLPRWL